MSKGTERCDKIMAPLSGMVLAETYDRIYEAVEHIDDGVARRLVRAVASEIHHCLKYKFPKEKDLIEAEACGMGYPDLGLPCVRPKDHPGIQDCFALTERDGVTWGVFMRQDSKDWISDVTLWPTDIVISTPIVEPVLPKTDRRGAIAHTKAKGLVY